MPPVCLEVIFHWLGGLASGSFYVPYKAVKKWSWEVYWLAGGFFSWIIAPWIMAMILTGGLFPSLSEVFSGKVGESTVQYAIDNPTHVSSGIFRQDTILEAYNQNTAAFNNVRKEKVKVDANGKFD
ncbi:MAG: hypothetical protein J6X44_09180, partial [Thermoguttaceae bacterium]|nr:hypothetical protein [Thermoguttaceae bacterium]